MKVWGVLQAGTHWVLGGLRLSPCCVTGCKVFDAFSCSVLAALPSLLTHRNANSFLVSKYLWAEHLPYTSHWGPLGFFEKQPQIAIRVGPMYWWPLLKAGDHSGLCPSLCASPVSGGPLVALVLVGSTFRLPLC